MSDFVDEPPKEEVDEDVAAMFDLSKKKKKKKKKVVEDVVEEGGTGAEGDNVVADGGGAKISGSSDELNAPPYSYTLTEWSLEVAVARGLAVYIYHECALCE